MKATDQIVLESMKGAFETHMTYMDSICADFGAGEWTFHYDGDFTVRAGPHLIISLGEWKRLWEQAGVGTPSDTSKAEQP